MFTQDLLAARIRIMSLSQIRQMMEDVKNNPDKYKKDTIEYCEAMYDIISSLSDKRNAEIVGELVENYSSMGIYDEVYIVDSLLALALASYQNELGEPNIYDMGWTKSAWEFFRTACESKCGDAMWYYNN